ncbi:MAG TPA: sigma-54 dependent transcriptional regulator [Balneolales bacterium]|nr:sigma-54 dependent transcriptional regulator [Balneolales bacterium]
METDLIGVSANIVRVRELIQRIADTGLNTIVFGETGVGKELVVKSLYQQSDRNGGPFVKVNCAALPDNLLESEMFGYERGAFTGAQRKMRGKFEQANRGVLFLDEIGDMSLSLQAKLLHALQDGEFIPLGSEKTVKSNAWVIAATNRDLAEDLRAEKFREDLYYRISMASINIDPIRKRPEDIAPLISYYFEQYASQLKAKHPLNLNENLMAKLTAYHWPGNVRELQNVLRRIIVLGEGEESINAMIPVTDLGRKVRKDSTGGGITSKFIGFSGLNGQELDLSDLSLKKYKKQVADQVEKDVISYVLEKTGWNRTRATRILKVSYKTLLTKIKELELRPLNNFE